ncbi:MAG: T9SS type A sorting domain-containing protein [Candidatus Krumholzibacteriota bacterium]|nr:T9SS type A sorting domain-containing protein [Candidatus Krumholzibacteriota bacterium]
MLTVAGSDVVELPEAACTVCLRCVEDHFFQADRIVFTFLSHTGGDPTPAARAALGVYPNPFNPSTVVRFSLPAAGRAVVTVHDAAGREIARLADEWLSEGEHVRNWDGRDRSGRPAASGVYVCRLAAGGPVVSRKMVLLR